MAVIPLDDESAVDDQPDTETPEDAEERQGNPQKAEATDELITFEYDGEEWTFHPSAATQLDFLAALEAADTRKDAYGLIRAIKILLGEDQAEKFFKGRQVREVREFLRASAKAGGSGNR